MFDNLFPELSKARQEYRRAIAELEGALRRLRSAQGPERLRAILRGQDLPDPEEAKRALAEAEAKVLEARKVLALAKADAQARIQKALEDEILAPALRAQLLVWAQEQGLGRDLRVPPEVLEVLLEEDALAREVRRAKRAILQALRRKAWEKAERLLSHLSQAEDDEVLRRARKAVQAALRAKEGAQRASWWAKAQEALRQGLVLYIDQAFSSKGLSLPAWAAIGQPGHGAALKYGQVPFEVCPEKGGLQGSRAIHLARLFAERAREEARRAAQARNAHLRALGLAQPPKAQPKGQAKPPEAETQGEGLGTVGLALIEAARRNPEAAQALGLGHEG